ncbi:hypothetical protein BC629DRAFT_1439063 [Irpex lacteus]|nr:hypothetical protein BC629DRAFT_1439063 [Irpex lacteus]
MTPSSTLAENTNKRVQWAEEVASPNVRQALVFFMYYFPTLAADSTIWQLVCDAGLTPLRLRVKATTTHAQTLSVITTRLSWELPSVTTPARTAASWLLGPVFKIMDHPVQRGPHSYGLKASPMAFKLILSVRELTYSTFRSTASGLGVLARERPSSLAPRSELVRASSTVLIHTEPQGGYIPEAEFGR